MTWVQLIGLGQINDFGPGQRPGPGSLAWAQVSDLGPPGPKPVPLAQVNDLGPGHSLSWAQVIDLGPGHLFGPRSMTWAQVSDLGSVKTHSPHQGLHHLVFALSAVSKAFMVR